MLGHLGLNVPDLRAAKTYYDAVMPLLGFDEFLTAEDEFAYRPAGGKPGTYLFFYQSARGVREYPRHRRRGLQHLAFMHADARSLVITTAHSRWLCTGRQPQFGCAR